MVTVVRKDGIKVIVFSNDHPPAHCRVTQAGKKAKFLISGDWELIQNQGFLSRELKKIRNILQENEAIIKKG